MSAPRPWYELYPQGTKEGDEEQKFFKALCRHPKYEWRSAAAIAKETGLNISRVEEIIAKYHPLGVVVQSKSDDNWGYYQRVAKSDSDKRSLSQKDKDSRIDKAKKKEADAPVAVTP